MSKKTNYEKHFAGKMKSKSFQDAYQEEKHRLEIAYAIAQLRKKQHISQQELAKRIGTTQSAVARMEAGQQNFTTDTLQKVAAAFKRDMKIAFVKH